MLSKLASIFCKIYSGIPATDFGLLKSSEGCCSDSQGSVIRGFVYSSWKLS